MYIIVDNVNWNVGSSLYSRYRLSQPGFQDPRELLSESTVATGRWFLRTTCGQIHHFVFDQNLRVEAYARLRQAPLDPSFPVNKDKSATPIRADITQISCGPPGPSILLPIILAVSWIL